MAKRLIDAEDVKELLKGLDSLPWDEEVDEIVDRMEAVEPKRGEWLKTFRYMRENINTGNLEPVYSYDCPICKYHTGNQGGKFNFCPNCGSDMRKKVRNELGRRRR